MSPMVERSDTAIDRTATWRLISEWKRAPHLAEAMVAFPCKGDARYWSVAVVCDPNVYVDCLSDEDRQSGMWALVPYPYPQSEATR